MRCRRIVWLCSCSLWILAVLMTFPQTIHSGTETSEPLTVYVVNYPLKYFAQRIAGDHAKLEFPCPDGEDPAYWVPNVSIISAYQKADLILLNGADYAKWINKVSLPRSKMVNTSIKFKDRYIKLEEAVTHSHGPEGQHEHRGIAFTTWLDFDLAAKQADAIFAAMVSKQPELKATFQENYVGLRKDLEALERGVQAVVAKAPSRPLIASHPVYQYLAARYGINVKSLHWEPDQVPGEEEWQQLKDLLKDHPARWMIWEGKPVQETLDKLKSLGIASVVFDPCSNAPSKGDFITVMRENVRNLAKAIE
ncbi:metal ABC transporter substrate-binding protein [Thermodesulfobacteriota bacterium]